MFGKPSGGGLFGSNSGTGLFGNNTGGSLFNSGNSLFGQQNIFTKDNKDKEKSPAKDDGSGDEEAGNESDGPPAMADVPAAPSPFDKVFVQEVAKFKVAAPVKRTCGRGKISLVRGEFGAKGEGKKAIVVWKVVFKNAMGKVLYNADVCRVSK